MRRLCLRAALAAAVLAALAASSLYSYLLFHALAELFAVVIAGATFVLAWNARRFLANPFLLFVGIAFAAVGVIDLAHTLAYRGMGVFPGDDADAATQLWLAARAVQSLSLLAAPLFFRRPLRPGLLLGGFTALGAALLALVATGRFPTAFVEGHGLTPFKTAAEYGISLVLLGAGAHLFAHRRHTDPTVLRLLLCSIGLTIASELAFTLYTDPFGAANLLGHLLKVVAFYLVYHAIVVVGLRTPYDLLFREVKQSEERYRALFTQVRESEERLRELNAQLDRRVLARTAQIRALALALTAAEERERARIAALLHDHHQQLLAGAKMMATALRRGLEEGPARTADALVDLLDQALQSSRSLSHELSPPVLRRQGLAAALEWLAGEMGARHGLRVEVRCQPGAADEVPQPVQTFLFQATRELLFNVVKHAGVAQARVDLAADAEALRLTVTDEGRGLARTPDGAPPPEGAGLTGIRERMELLGGRLEVENGPERGARFALVVPPEGGPSGAGY
jgi:signal transduction histidine kinase